MKADRVPYSESIKYELDGTKKWIGVRINRDTYDVLMDIKRANGMKSLDATIREIVTYVAMRGEN